MGCSSSHPGPSQSTTSPAKLDCTQTADDTDAGVSVEAKQGSVQETGSQSVHRSRDSDTQAGKPTLKDCQDGAAIFVFGAYDKLDTGKAVGLVKERVLTHVEQQGYSGLQFCLDSDDQNLEDLATVLLSLRRSMNFILFLTSAVLARPWVACEVVHAVRAECNIILVIVRQYKKNFEIPDAQWYAETLPSLYTAEDLKLLADHGVTIADIRECLPKVFGIACKELSGSKDPITVHAEVRDIISCCVLPEKPSENMTCAVAREFWDAHWATESIVLRTDLRSALISDFDSSNTAAIDSLLEMLPCQTELTMADVDTLFTGCNSIKDLLHDLQMKSSEPTRVWPIRVKGNGTVAGFVAIKQSDSLRDVREEIALALEDDDRSDTKFLREGKFCFFLQGGKTKVHRKQESIVRDPNLVDSSIVGCDEIAAETEEKTQQQSTRRWDELAVSETTDVSVDISVDGDEGPPSRAKAILKLKAEAAAQQLDLNTVLNNPGLSHEFKKILKQLSLPEEYLDFLKQLQELENEGLGTGCRAVTEGRSTGVEMAAMASQFFKTGAPMNLGGTAAERERFRTAAKSGDKDQEMQLVLRSVKERIVAEVSPALSVLKSQVANSGRVAKSLLSGKDMQGKQRVVIVGGGFGGMIVYKMLQDLPHINVTLVDAKEYFEWTPFLPAALMDPTIWPQVNIPFKEIIGSRDDLVTSWCEEIHPDHVVVGASKTVIPFDYLVVALGSTQMSAVKTTDPSGDFRQKQLAVEHQSFLAADKIVVVGAGFVGVEVAANARDRFPEKAVILIQAETKIMPRCERAHDHCMKWFKEHSVEVMSNSRVSSVNGKQLVTESGRKIDISNAKVVWATGYSPNSSPFSRDRALQKLLDDKGFVRTEKTLQLPGFQKIFALGDLCTSERFSQGERMTMFAEAHGFVVAENIKRLSSAKRGLDPKLLRWTPPAQIPVTFVDLGSKDLLMVLEDNDAFSGFCPDHWEALKKCAFTTSLGSSRLMSIFPAAEVKREIAMRYIETWRGTNVDPMLTCESLRLFWAFLGCFGDEERATAARIYAAMQQPPAECTSMPSCRSAGPNGCQVACSKLLIG